MWKVYKSKVMKTLNPEYEEDAAEEVLNLHDTSYLFAILIQKVRIVMKVEVVLATEARDGRFCLADHFLFMVTLQGFRCSENFRGEVWPKLCFLLCI